MGKVKRSPYRFRNIRVRCKECNNWSDEKDVEFVNIEEGMQGEDILTFVCPICTKVVRSRRFG